MKYVFDWDSLISQTGTNIVLDTGHLTIGNSNCCFHFGREKCGPSASEELTFRMGFEIADRLIEEGKRCSVHLCFSDTTKNFDLLETREILKEKITSGEIETLLPPSYLKCKSEHPHIEVRYSLQTQNSNLFSSQIKKLKKNIKKHPSAESVFQEHQALFVEDLGKDLFGFVHPYLFDISKEQEIMKGDWWLDETATIHPSDLTRLPMLMLKKMGVINVFSKNAGILCPGTYAGLLLELDPNADRIAIYARNDDDTIGEKILRGMIASYIVSPQIKGKSFLFTIPKHLQKIEASVVERPLLNRSADFHTFLSTFYSRGLNIQYKGYHHEIPLL